MEMTDRQTKAAREKETEKETDRNVSFWADREMPPEASGSYFVYHEYAQIHNIHSIMAKLQIDKINLKMWFAWLLDEILQWRHNGHPPLFTQPFIRAQIKENIEVPRHWPLCGEFTGDR